MDSSRFTVPQDLFEAWEIKEKKALISAPQEKLEAEKKDRVLNFVHIPTRKSA